MFPHIHIEIDFTEKKHGGVSPSSKSRPRTSTSPRDKSRKSDNRGSKRNHTNPVVKVERMPSDVVRQKLNKRTLAYETERPRPPEKPGLKEIAGKFVVEEEVTELITIKPEELAAAMAGTSMMGIKPDEAPPQPQQQQVIDLVEQEEVDARQKLQQDEVALAVEALSAI